MVVPPVLAREADDTFTLERILIVRLPLSVPLHPGLHFSRQAAVVWIWIQLAGNPAPYSREICAGRMISVRDSPLHTAELAGAVPR